VSDSDVDAIREVNDAIAKGDPGAVASLLHPDIVWEHNIGVGSPEEGVYRGRESVIGLFERIVETWEYIRPEPRSIELLDDGRYRVRGELRAKHRTSDTEISTSYEQHLEVSDEELVKGWMNTGEISLSVNSSNSVAVRRFVDAFNRRDFDALVADAGPGTVLHEWPEAPGAQSYRGPEGMREALRGRARDRDTPVHGTRARDRDISQ